MFFSCLLFAGKSEFYLNIPNPPEHSGLKGIDCLYVINLARRSQKWALTKFRLEEWGLHPHRVEAVDGWAISDAKKKELTGDFAPKMNGGKLGCFLSHLSIYRDAMKRNFHAIWVFEDDILVCCNPHQISRVIEELSILDPDWDVLYTDFDTRNKAGDPLTPQKRHLDLRNPYIKLKPAESYFSRRRITEELSTTGFRWGMYSMVISKKGVQKLVRTFDALPLWAPIDHLIHYIPDIYEYSLVRPVVTVDRKSTISDTLRKANF